MSKREWAAWWLLADRISFPQWIRHAMKKLLLAILLLVSCAPAQNINLSFTSPSCTLNSSSQCGNLANLFSNVTGPGGASNTYVWSPLGPDYVTACVTIGNASGSASIFTITAGGSPDAGNGFPNSGLSAPGFNPIPVSGIGPGFGGANTTVSGDGTIYNTFGLTGQGIATFSFTQAGFALVEFKYSGTNARNTNIAINQVKSSTQCGNVSNGSISLNGVQAYTPNKLPPLTGTLNYLAGGSYSNLTGQNGTGIIYDPAFWCPNTVTKSWSSSGSGETLVFQGMQLGPTTAAARICTIDYQVGTGVTVELDTGTQTTTPCDTGTTVVAGPYTAALTAWVHDGNAFTVPSFPSSQQFCIKLGGNTTGAVTVTYAIF